REGGLHGVRARGGGRGLRPRARRLRAQPDRRAGGSAGLPGARGDGRARRHRHSSACEDYRHETRRAAGPREAAMKFVDEYRSEEHAHAFLEAIQRTITRPWTLMEICGGQTHTLLKHGIDELLPREITLVHGPGCPVCVTPIELIDRAIEIARRPEVLFTSFGDMLRVPGTRSSLLNVKAAGADVRMVYSPLDAVSLPRQNKDRDVVFFAVGFETTAPANAMAIYEAARLGLTNFSVLSAHVLVPPAMEAILSPPDNAVQG